jgi:hypothetical protein
MSQTIGHVAQLEARLTTNQEVAGSSPALLINFGPTQSVSSSQLTLRNSILLYFFILNSYTILNSFLNFHIKNVY